MMKNDNNKKHVEWNNNNEFVFYFIEENIDEENYFLDTKKHTKYYHYNQKNKVNVDNNDIEKNIINQGINCNHIRIENINCVIPKRHGIVQEPFHWIFQHQWNASNKLHKKEVFPIIIKKNKNNNNNHNNEYIFVDLLKNKRWLNNKNKLEIEMLYALDYVQFFDEDNNNNDFNLLFHIFLDIDEILLQHEFDNDDDIVNNVKYPNQTTIIVQQHDFFSGADIEFNLKF